MTPVILKLSTRGKSLFCSTPQPSTSWGRKKLFSLNRMLGVSQCWSGRFREEKSLTPAGNGDRSSTVVKVLCYKLEGCWFDSRWFHWNFSLT